MELEEMKSLWSDLSVKVEKQDRIHRELILEITKQKFRSRLNSIQVSELLGAVVCFAGAAYFIVNFGKLEIWYNQVFALINILIAVILPLLSLSTIRAMKNLQIGSESPIAIIKEFTKRKLRFWQVQRLSLVLASVYLLTILLPFAELQGKSDLFMSPNFGMVYIPLGFALMLMFSSWVWKKYKGGIAASEELLRELAE